MKKIHTNMRDFHIRHILKDEVCLEIVRKKLNRETVEDYELIRNEIVPLTAVNGFMGQYFNLCATIKEKNSENLTVIKLFIKLPPPAGSPQDEFNQEMGNCKKEFDIYNLVFPKIMDKGSNDFCIPECYWSFKDTVIVLDDMKNRGFKMTNKYKSFDYEHCAILLKALGEFHAKSVTFEVTSNKNLQDEFSHCLNETLWPLDKIRSIKMLTAAEKGVISLVQLLSELTEDQKRKFKEKITELTFEHPKKLLPSKKYRNVLCHGDLWANNLLFKYNDGNPVDCCLIDFQLARLNPPAHDILCFLQFSTTSDLRMKHLDDLLHIYHESFKNCLRKNGHDADLIFSWDELKNSIKDFRIVCMLHGVLNVPMQLIDENATNKYFVRGSDNVKEDFHLDRSPLFCEQFNQVPLYKFRIKDLLLELYEHIFGQI